MRLDHAIESAARHGIFVFIDPAETIGWLATLRNNGLDASYAYGQYLGRRYGKYTNVAWLSGNDFHPMAHSGRRCACTGSSQRHSVRCPAAASDRRDQLQRQLLTRRSGLGADHFPEWHLHLRGDVHSNAAQL